VRDIIGSSVFFTLHGAWYILVLVLALSAVGFAFLIYARHATARKFAVVEDYLPVELVLAGETSCFKLDLRQMRITPMRPGKHLVTLVSSEIRVEVGRHLTKWERRESAQALGCAIIASRVVKWLTKFL